MYAEGKEDLAAVFQHSQDFLRRWQADGSDIVVQNITKQKTQNEELLYMAYYDSLTGLYNRNYFVRLLTEFLRRAKEDNRLVSVLVIDIDDFRKVNDGLGIVAGDELVQQFGSF